MIKSLRIGIDAVAILAPLLLGAALVSPFVIYSVAKFELKEKMGKNVE